MYKSPKTSWFKGMITIDTSVKPKEGVSDDGNALDIQWNVYVILLLRRHNLISIKSMVYNADKESYKIRIDILDDALRSEALEVPQIIIDIRDKESAGFEKEIKRIKNGIDFSERICWSDMFYSTYDKVSMYCGGCAKHKYPEMMEEGKFPLLLPVKEPKKQISAELNKLCQGENEVLVIGEEDDYSLMNRYVNAGANVIIVEDTNIESDFDLILNMNKQSNVMIFGIKEYRDLCSKGSAYYVSGGVIALYNSGVDKAYEFCSTLRKYKNADMRLIHIVKEDYFIQKVQKPISAMVEGPKIDSYILERM